MSTPLVLGSIALVVSERLESALRERSFGPRLPVAEPGFCLLWVQSGEVLALPRPETAPDAAPATAPTRIAGPALAWLPWPDGAQLRLRAGSAGTFALIAESLLSVAIGHNAESGDLWQLARTRLILPLAEDRETRAECAAAMAMIQREAIRPAPGSISLIESQTRLLLVHLWRGTTARMAGMAGMAADEPQARQLLLRFRQLLEMHFRSRWSVARYAEALNISADRLHDLCQRHLGKPPGRLIRERLAHEAGLMLERSSLTVDQLSATLGFSDAPQFSRFFAAHAGLPPARWRKTVATARRAGQPGVAAPSYADWP